jgi:hypothetical protein
MTFPSRKKLRTTVQSNSRNFRSALFVACLLTPFLTPTCSKAQQNADWNRRSDDWRTQAWHDTNQNAQPQRSLQWQTPSNTDPNQQFETQPIPTPVPKSRPVDRDTVRANFQHHSAMANQSANLPTGRVRQVHRATDNPFKDPFGDARPTPTSTHQSPFVLASYATETSQPQPMRPRLTAPKLLPGSSGASSLGQTLQIQSPRLAQSEEPSLDDLQLYDDEQFPIPSAPSKPSEGVFDFTAPEANPLGENLDMPDAPGDFPSQPGTFPDAPEPSDVTPNSLPDPPKNTDSFFPEDPAPATPPPEALPELDIPASPFDEPTQPAIPDPDSDLLDPFGPEPTEPMSPQPEIDDFPFDEPSTETPTERPLTEPESPAPERVPDTMPAEPFAPEQQPQPQPQIPQPEPESIPEPTEPDFPPTSPDPEPAQTLPDPYEDNAPRLPDPEPTFEADGGSSVDQDRNELQRELDELENRLGTPRIDEDEDQPKQSKEPKRPRGDGRDAFADDEDQDDEDKEFPCDRIYDERNCCEQENECRTAWDRLTKRRVMDISLDITPPYSPLPEDIAESAQDKAERLAKAPSRVWYDRGGQSIANGRLVDFRDGQIFVDTIDGRVSAIPFQHLSHDDLCFITAWWGLPGECTVLANDDGIRDWRMCTFTWKASSLCHKPLYFEDVQLERYGHSAGPFLQPLFTTAHFFSNVLLLPYNMGVYPPNECRYPLGHYRPGSCAPWLVPAFPLSERGAKAELITILAMWGFAS